MQFSGDTALAAAVDSSDRILVQKVEFDWNHDGLYNHLWSNMSALCSEITIERSLMTVLPEECSTVEGFQSAKMTLRLEGTIAGSTLDIAQILSPYRTDSPLYPPWWFVSTPVRVHITVRKADGTETLIPQFTGFISEVTISSSDRSVIVTCLDGSEKCRVPITLAPSGMFTWYYSGSTGENWRHNTQWVIDYVLRKCGYYSSPPITDSPIYSATGHGSPHPDVGHESTLRLTLGQEPPKDQMYVPGVYGLAVNGTPQFFLSWWTRGMDAFTPQTGDTNEWSIQFLAKFGAGTVRHPDTSGTVIHISTGDSIFNGTTMSVRIDTTTGQAFLELRNGGSVVYSNAGPTFASDAWHNVAVKIKFNSMTNAVITWIGQSPQTGINLTAAGLPSTPAATSFRGGIIMTIYPFPVQCIQFKKSAGTVTWYDTGTFVPTASLDPGINQWISIPEVRDQEAWQVLKEVVESEYGVIGFDESGNAYFRNRNTLRNSGLTIEKTITDQTTLVDLSLSTRSESIRNVITLPVQPRWQGTVETVWDIKDLDEEWFLTSGAHGFTVDIDEPMQILGVINLFNYSTGVWDGEDLVGGFVAINTVTNTEVAATVSCWQQYYNPYQIVFYITNPVTDPIKFRTTTGNPALRVPGYPVKTSDTLTTTFRRQSSINLYGERTLSLPTNPWAQDSRYTQDVALSLMKDLKRPVPTIERIPVVGDPRLQMTDTVQIEDVNGMGGPILAGVAGITRTFSGGKLTDSLTPRPVGSPGSWILGHSQRSVLGSTTVPG
jgi:hypothetical protein